jgi:DNA polymerase-4
LNVSKGTSERTSSRVIFHVDMDAFYASVEQNDHPEYRGQPVIIGAAPGHRGVVSACSYEARRYGVRSAMPISEAYQRCPGGVYLPVRMERYQEVSRAIMCLLDDFTPIVHQISVDEAFLDMTGTERLFGPPLEAGRTMRGAIRRETGLAMSVGIAPNPFLAKLASEFGKPDGLHRVERGEEEGFLDQLELGDLWGVGKKTQARLRELNIHSIPQLRSLDRSLLAAMLGDGAAGFLFNAVRGIDPGTLNIEPKSKSISSEITFEKDTANRETIDRVLLDIAHQVFFRLIDEGFKSKTGFVKLRYSDFTSTTIQRTMGHYAQSAEELYDLYRSLFAKRYEAGRKLRLLGAGLQKLEVEDRTGQIELFEDGYEKRRKVEHAVFDIKQKKLDIHKASLMGKRRRESDDL